MLIRAEWRLSKVCHHNSTTFGFAKANTFPNLPHRHWDLLELACCFFSVVSKITLTIVQTTIKVECRLCALIFLLAGFSALAQGTFIFDQQSADETTGSGSGGSIQQNQPVGQSF